MCCILCLSESSEHILLNSTAASALGIEKMIQKYINLQFVKTIQEASYICQQCCQSLLDFHKFLLRIEAAHNLLTDVKNIADIDPLEVQILTADLIEIKQEICDELDLNIVKSENVATINECAAPRYTLRTTTNNKAQAKLEDSQQTEVTAALNCKSKRKTNLRNRKQTTARKKCLENNVENEESSIDKIDSKNDVQVDIKKATNKSSDTFKNNDNQHNISFEYSLENNTATNKVTKKVRKPDEIDEFIAANFNLSCDICTLQLPYFCQLKSHYSTVHHKRNGYAICCGKKLLKRCLLVDHINMHKNPDYFKCATCEKTFASRYSLELHSKVHGTRERIYKCKTCSKSFFNRHVYVRHLQLHAPDDQKKFVCPQCDERFYSEYSRNQHLKCVHTDLHVKVCELCGKSIRGLGTLRQHMELHTRQDTNQCSHCGLKVTTKYGLVRHIRKMHSETNKQPKKCNICFKVSASLSAHNYHMVYMHKTKHMHTCTMCNKSFKRASALKEHLTTHNGGSLYTCWHCPKTFNSKANMYSHRKKAHPEEWTKMRLEKFPNLSDANINAQKTE